MKPPIKSRRLTPKCVLPCPMQAKLTDYPSRSPSAPLLCPLAWRPRVAVHAAGVEQDLARLLEECNGAPLRIGDRRRIGARSVSAAACCGRAESTSAATAAARTRGVMAGLARIASRAGGARGYAAN